MVTWEDKSHHSKCPPFLLSLTLCTEHDVIWYGIFLWSVYIICPSYASPNFFCLPPHWQSMRQGGKKIFMINMTWEKPKISVCYQCHSHSESKTALLIAPEINTILDEARIPGLLADD